MDALRLAAIVLAHWDHKSENQRLVCLDDGPSTARLFGSLTHGQVRELFDAAGVARFDQVVADGHDPDAWADAFTDKVRQIADGPACESAAALVARGQ